MAPSMHMALYPILMKGNTNRYIILCIYCQNEKTPLSTPLLKTRVWFLNNVNHSCTLNKEIFVLFLYIFFLGTTTVHRTASYILWQKLKLWLSPFFIKYVVCWFNYQLLCPSWISYPDLPKYSFVRSNKIIQNNVRKESKNEPQLISIM